MNRDINRFIEAQERDFDLALSEIRKGRKYSHWMWYIFPQRAGYGYSEMSVKYAINDINEAREYIANEYLRNNLVTITKALLELDNGNIDDILGFPDNMKLRSCMTLFEYVAPEIKEFGMVLDKYFDGGRDKGTIEFLEDMVD